MKRADLAPGSWGLTLYAPRLSCSSSSTSFSDLLVSAERSCWRRSPEISNLRMELGKEARGSAGKPGRRPRCRHMRPRWLGASRLRAVTGIPIVDATANTTYSRNSRLTRGPTRCTIFSLWSVHTTMLANTVNGARAGPAEQSATPALNDLWSCVSECPRLDCGLLAAATSRSKARLLRELVIAHRRDVKMTTVQSRARRERNESRMLF